MGPSPVTLWQTGVGVGRRETETEKVTERDRETEKEKQTIHTEKRTHTLRQTMEERGRGILGLQSSRPFSDSITK